MFVLLFLCFVLLCFCLFACYFLLCFCFAVNLCNQLEMNEVWEEGNDNMEEDLHDEFKTTKRDEFVALLRSSVSK